MGQPKRGNVYGKTQKECRQKLTATLREIDSSSYRKQKRYTVNEWLTVWLEVYCENLKPQTVLDYQQRCKRYIIPNIGKVQLSALSPVQVQKFCNRLSEGYEGQAPLAPKSVKNIHGILHSALKQAVLSGVLTSNPADNIKLPKCRKPELKPLMDDDITRFLEQIRGEKFQRLFIVDLFTGLRQSELLGLEWGDIDFEAGEIHVCRQLQKLNNRGYVFVDTTKSDKDRTVIIPATVVKVLKEQKKQQTAWQLKAGYLWDNPNDLVFTNEQGGHLIHKTVYAHFKKAVAAIGMSETRFHDMRHSCAIMALQAGCSVKAVQEQLGHYSSAFTMDTYAAVSNTMKKDTQCRIENLIKQVSNL
jgi:integrase